MSEIMPGLTSATEYYKIMKDGKLSKFLEDKSDSDVQSGVETYAFTAQVSEREMAGPPQGPNQKAITPIILHDAKNNVSSIYLNAAACLSAPEYVTALCLFIDNAPPNATIKMYLGSSIDDNHTIGISSILYSIQHAKANIETYAYGMCSIPETMIWSYGKKRIMGKYGVIQFGGGEWIRRMKDAFQPYIQTYLDHCKELNILNDEQIEDIVVKQKNFMFMVGDNDQLTEV